MKKAKLDTLFAAIKSIIQALTPLPGDERVRALRWVLEEMEINLGVSQTRPAPTTPAPAAPSVAPHAPSNGSGTISPKQFMDGKEPKTDVERVACLAYFLTNHRGVVSFGTKDLTALNHEARGRAFSNLSMSSANAVRQGGYLAPAGHGKKRITDRGEKLVDALPDRERAKAILAATRGRKKRGRRKTAKSVK